MEFLGRDVIIGIQRRRGLRLRLLFVGGVAFVKDIACTYGGYSNGKRQRELNLLLYFRIKSHRIKVSNEACFQARDRKAHTDGKSFLGSPRSTPDSAVAQAWMHPPGRWAGICGANGSGSLRYRTKKALCKRMAELLAENLVSGRKTYTSFFRPAIETIGPSARVWHLM